VSTAGLLGKMKKMKSVSSGYALVPRVTQVQQIFSIDIVFVKGVAFLLGVLTSLGLGLVEFLRDRLLNSIETAVNIMLAMLRAVPLTYSISDATARRPLVR